MLNDVELEAYGLAQGNTWYLTVSRYNILRVAHANSAVNCVILCFGAMFVLASSYVFSLTPRPDVVDKY